MTETPTLATWFRTTVETQGVASRSTLYTLVGLKTCRIVIMIAGFWLFAHMMHSLVVLATAPSMADWIGLSVALLLAWLLQGEAYRRTLEAKTQLLQDLEVRFTRHLAIGQLAMVGQQSPYYWQSLWLHHIPALANWRYDYQVQQYVAVLAPIIALAGLSMVNWLIGLSLLITLPIVPLFMVLVGKGAAAQQRKHFTALTRLGSLFTDRLKALPLLATYRAHDSELALLKQASDDLNDRTMSVVGVAFLSNTVLDFFSTVAVALVAVFIGFTLLSEFAVGPVINLHHGLWLLLTAPLLFSELKALGQYYHQKAEAESAQSSLGQWVEAIPNEALDAALNKAGVFDEPQQFTLRHEQALISATNLVLCPGDKVAVSGPSGSGKTILLQALAGQYQAGYSLPCKVALLTQQPVLLPMSVRANLEYQQAHTTSALWQVLAQVELDDWVRTLPQQLDTPLHETPAISGGQAQRLALARVLLSEAPVWLLDEPTAHLPTEQHAQISELIQRLSEQKTVLWVSHKPLPTAWFTRSWQVKEGEVTVQ